MISDDGAAYTHFCYAKSSKKSSSWKKNRCPKCFVPTSPSEVFFRPRSRSKTQTLMYLAGKASYRLENRILGNDFGRRSCLYAFLLGQILQKKQFFKNKLRWQFFFGVDFFLKNCFLSKIWPSKSGYRHLRRPKSLPRMRFSSLYDASPPRNITVCVFDLDLGRKKTSLRKGAPDLSKKKQKCKLISYQYYKIFVLKSQQKPSGK